MEHGRTPRVGDIRRFFLPRSADGASQVPAARTTAGAAGNTATQTAATGAKKALPGAASTPAAALLAASRESAGADKQKAAGAAREEAADSATASSSSRSKKAAALPKKRKGAAGAAESFSGKRKQTKALFTSAGDAASAIDVDVSSPTTAARLTPRKAKKQQKQQQKPQHECGAEQETVHSPQGHGQEKKLKQKQQQTCKSKAPRERAETSAAGEGNARGPGGSSNKKSWRRLRRGGEASSSSDEDEDDENAEKGGSRHKEKGGNAPTAAGAALATAASHSQSGGWSSGGPSRAGDGPPPPIAKTPPAVVKATAGGSSGSSNLSSGWKGGPDAGRGGAAAAGAATKQEVTDIDAFFAAALEEDLHKAKKGAAKGHSAPAAVVNAQAAAADAAAKDEKVEKKSGDSEYNSSSSSKESSSSRDTSRSSSSAKRSLTGEAKEWARLLEDMAPAKIRQQQQQRKATAVESSSDEEPDAAGGEKKSREEGPSPGKGRRAPAGASPHRVKGTAAAAGAAEQRRKKGGTSSSDGEFVVSSDTTSSSGSEEEEDEEEEDEEEEDEDPTRRQHTNKNRKNKEGRAVPPTKKTLVRQKVRQQQPAEVAASPRVGKDPHLTAKTNAALMGDKNIQSKSSPGSSTSSSSLCKEEGVSSSLPFAGKIFVFTGVLDSLGRDEAAATVMRLGGRCTSAVSGRTDYLVMGGVLEDGREVTSGSKYRKATQLQQQHGLSAVSATGTKTIQILTEAQFLAMLPVAPVAAAASSSSAGQTRSLPFPAAVTSQAGAPACPTDSRGQASSHPPAAVSMRSSGSSELLWAEKYRPCSLEEIVGNRDQLRSLQTWLADWKDVCLLGKKKPPPSRSFTPSHSPFGFAPQLNMNARAALLSGPPGIGKTTAARIAAQEAGFTVVELNASDTRSKSHVEGLGDMASGGRTLHAFFPGKTVASEGAQQQSQHPVVGDVCLLMDEVDGLSGGDRGGAQAIVKLLENSKCPLICICNDRMHPKVRTLASKCLDLRFLPPHKGALRQRVAAVATAENLPLDAAAIDHLVEAAGGDMRQILNNMQLLSYDVKSAAAAAAKDGGNLQEQQQHGAAPPQLQVRGLGVKDEQVLYGPFECCKQLLDAQLSAGLSLTQKLDRFFVDYDMLPLLIQENYIEAFRQGAARAAAPSLAPAVSPYKAAQQQQRRGGGGGSAQAEQRSQEQQTQGGRHQQDLALRLTAAAAMDISEADMMNNVLRGTQTWGLLPDLGFLFCVSIPSKVEQLPAAGVGRVQFPSWLGRNSTQTKHKRLFTELLLLFMRKPSCCSSTSGLKLTGYLDALYERCVAPLVQQKQQQGGKGEAAAAVTSKEKAIEQTLHEMEVYGLTRDMLLENLQSLRLKNEPSLYDQVDSKTKTAFTRTYNSTAARKAGLVSAVMKKRREGKTPSAVLHRERGQEPTEEVEGAEEEEEEEDAGDFLIVKRTASKAAKSNGRGGGGAGKKRSRAAGEQKTVGGEEAADVSKKGRKKKRE